MFAALYKALEVFGLDEGKLFIYGPRLLQSIFASLGDYFTYKLTLRLFRNQTIANWGLLLSIVSWWNFFCSTRTLANSMEAALTVMALFYWPFNNDDIRSQSASTSLPRALAIASITCIFRPTAAVLWIFLGARLLLSNLASGNIGAFSTTALTAISIGATAIAGSIVLDATLLYHRFVVTPVAFLRINVLQGISLFYGSSPWHWYLSQGLPILFGIYTPFVLHGAWISWSDTTVINSSMKRQVIALSLWVLVVYSCLSHKEWRFLYPILYPMLPFGAHSIFALTSRRTAGTWSKWIAVLLLTVNAPMAWYLTMVHQRGVIDVMGWLKTEIKTGRAVSVGFLMPCHSTPWYSEVHTSRTRDVNMWFLTCYPPIENADPLNYKDESDIFYDDPVEFLRNTITNPSIRRNTSHLIMFEDLIRTHQGVDFWLQEESYYPCARFFNSHFHDDSRRRGDVLVYCKG